MKKIISLLLCITTIIMGVSSCGTILYPERSASPNKGGKLDIGVVLLDGIGLFFFIIPGVIAYAVDFINGTIYLPNGGAHVNLNPADFDKKDMIAIHLGKENMTPKNINALVVASAGREVDTKLALSYKIKNNF